MYNSPSFILCVKGENTMGVFGGEHLGFAYGNFHSEDLGIVRTIDNRY
jgi:hypothetical protein